jgi:Ca-activated chloride channel family protein
MKKTLAVLALALGFVGSSLADGLIVIHDPPPWHPHPPIIRPPHPPHWPPPPPRVYQFAPLEVTYHHVNVKVLGQIARTDIDQEFFNPNDQRLEGTYLFPVPKGAQLDKFSMEIDGKPVEAELLPADKARKIYEDIVRKMKDPALLEYVDRDTFKVRIFPIEPRAPKRIKLSYTQLLKADDGLIGYTYPLNTEKFSAAPIKTVSVKIELDAKRPVKSIYSPSHQVEIKRHGNSSATIGFEAKNVKPDTDLQVFWSTEDKDIGVSLLTYKDAGEDGYFLLLASPGADGKAGKQVMPKDVAIVLDTSGSMAGKKLEQAKKALQFCVENLNDADRFEIIRFSTEAEALFEKLVAADAGNRKKANEFIKDLKPIGGTAIEEALVKALKLRPDKADRPYVVIFLTDGQPTIGNTKEEDILASVKKTDPGKTRVFCFGIGTDVNARLLDRITEQTRAVSQYVLPEEDLEVKVSNFYTKIKEPVMADPVLSITGDIKASKLYPTPLPDLFRGDQVVVVGRYTGSGPAAAVIEGNVSGQAKKYAYDVKFGGEGRDHEFIPRLWATRRIGFLLDEIRLRGENKELREETTELARKYGIVTPYTAYLIVEDESKRNVPVASRTMQAFDGDVVARREAGRAWNEMNLAKAGEGAVGGARGSGALRYADKAAAPGAPAQTEAYSGFGLAASTTPDGKQAAERLNQYTQQSRFVRGRNFFQNGEQWVDAEVQKRQNARRVKVKFNSDEYFALAAKHPDAAAWLSVGRNVQVALGETVYEVID